MLLQGRSPGCTRLADQLGWHRLVVWEIAADGQLWALVPSAPLRPGLTVARGGEALDSCSTARAQQARPFAGLQLERTHGVYGGGF